MFVNTLAVLALLGSAVADHGHVRTPLKSRDNTRNLQDEEEVHPCQIPQSAAIVPFEQRFAVYKPSYLENCLSSLPVNETLMLNHVYQTRRAFEEYYCFFNIVNDPSDSDPSSHQPELGYTIFSGPNEGQVNLHDELVALENNITENGATAATFWDLQLIINKLYDAHVTLSTLSFPYTSYQLNLIPGRQLSPDTISFYPTYMVSYDEDGELELYFVWEAEDGNMTSDKVLTMDGMTPYEFFLGLVNNPANGIGYQSPGARMNELLRTPGGDLGIMLFFPSVRPSDLLPETFDVVYETGEVETFYTGITFFDSGTYGALSQVPVIETPGAAFQAFAIALMEVENVSVVPMVEVLPFDSQKRHIVSPPVPPKPKQMQRTEYNFDEVIYLGGEIRAAFKIEDDFAVLKIQDFSILFPDRSAGSFAMLDIWSSFTAAAKEKGVKKAMIDVSGNGGGIAISGSMLALSMYPFTPYEIFESEYDSNYNGVMQAYNAAVGPFVDEIRMDLFRANDTELQEYLETLPEGFTEQLDGVTEALLSFCCLGDLETCQATKPECGLLYDLKRAIVTLDEFKSGPQFRSTIISLLDCFTLYNPFNIFGNQDKINKNTLVTSMRGGVSQNTTNHFSFFPVDLYWETVGRAFQNDWEFDEYAIVSDGAAGSTTCIFSATATQIWANRDLSGARTPLTTITYGGTKVPSDTTVAGFPASVQYVKIEYPLISSGLYHMTTFLIPDNITSSVLDTLNEYYQSFLPLPPYFAEGLPYMPVNNFYNHYMEPGALPLQYIKINGDEHIQQLFAKVRVEDSADLMALYKETASLAFTTEEAGPTNFTEEAGPEKAEENTEEGVLPDLAPLENSKDAPGP